MTTLDEPKKMNVTKETYRNLIWIILGVGLIINAVFYTLLASSLEIKELQFVGLLAIGCIIIGFALGMAFSRSWKIEGIDK